MKGYKLIGNSYSLRLLTPQKYKIVNQKLNIQNQKEKEKEIKTLKNSKFHK